MIEMRCVLIVQWLKKGVQSAPSEKNTKYVSTISTVCEENGFIYLEEKGLMFINLASLGSAPIHLTMLTI